MFSSPSCAQNHVCVAPAALQLCVFDDLRPCVCVCWGGWGVAVRREQEGRKEGRKKQKAAVLCVWGFFYASGFLFRILFMV